jgi:dihydropyrimidinase
MTDRQLDLVVRGGTIVTAQGRQQADLGVVDGRITQIGEAMRTAAREIDASGRFVLPGGVDPHVHLNVETLDPGEPNWVDDYTSGSEAALAGGVTSLGNMAYVLPWETLASRVRAESVLVARQAIADVFFHTVVVTPSPEIVAEVRPAVAAGQSSMKFFMCLPSFEAFAPQFSRIMKAAGEAGGITLIHCEDLPTIE